MDRWNVFRFNTYKDALSKKEHKQFQRKGFRYFLEKAIKDFHDLAEYERRKGTLKITIKYEKTERGETLVAEPYDLFGKAGERRFLQELRNLSEREYRSLFQYYDGKEEYRSLFQYYDGKENFSISDNLLVVINGLDGLHRFIGSLDATYWIPIGFGYHLVWCKKDPDTGIRHNRKEVQKVSQFLFDLYKIILASKEHLL